MNMGHLSREQIQAYLDGTMPPGDLLRADDHLDACAACRGRVGDIEERVARLQQIIHGTPDEAAHLEYKQLEALVDGRLDAAEREICETHLGDCPPCREEYEDLLALAPDLRRKVLAPRADIDWGGRRKPSFASRQRIVTALALAAALMLVAWAGYRRTMEPAPAPAGASLGTQQAPSERALLDLPPEVREAVRRVVASGHLDPPTAVSGLAANASTLMGAVAPPAAAATFGPTRPVGVVVTTDRPRFTWNGVAGATSYRVGIYDERLNEVEQSAAVTATTWSPTKPLARGRVYVWQVTAMLARDTLTAPAAPAPEARFAVLDARGTADLATLRRTHAGEPLVLGVALYQAGALDEAAVELAAFADANPGAPLAQSLLEDLRNATR